MLLYGILVFWNQKLAPHNLKSASNPTSFFSTNVSSGATVNMEPLNFMGMPPRPEQAFKYLCNRYPWVILNVVLGSCFELTII